MPISPTTKTGLPTSQHSVFSFSESTNFSWKLNSVEQKKNENKTYDDFKIHTRQEYNELAKVGGLTVENSNLHGVNLLKEIHTELMADSMRG